MATYGAESWYLNKAIAKRLAAFNYKFLEECLRELKEMNIGESDVIRK
jgi:hypothetical protein